MYMLLHSQIHQSDVAATNPPISSPYSSSSSSSSSSFGNRISPAILFIIVILAVVFFILGLLHLLVRFLTRHRSSSSSTSLSQSNRYQQDTSESSSYAYYHQRQLQQLFHLHDSGLDQSFIDALPVFLYKDIIGLKEPFDCAVCLCEFLEQDKLRLLPNCNHAFHINCIDTWLLSNSTCPLCRGSLYAQGFSFETPFFGFEGQFEEDVGSSASTNKPQENHIMCGKRVFSVRLGKFRSSNNVDGLERGEGESSRSCSNGDFDVRRCYSMGSYQYVVADSDLRVALCPSRGSGSMRQQLKGGRMIGATNGNCSSSTDIGDAVEGKKISNIARKGESFSVSKIWQWSRKDNKLTNNKFIRREPLP